MGCNDVIQRLRESRAVWEPYGVTTLPLFGSAVRDELRDDSDIDLLVEFGRPVGLFEFVRLRRTLEVLLGRRVDLVTAQALKRRLRDRIVAEAVRAA
jgi:predicted nucleotidyltransferase